MSRTDWLTGKLSVSARVWTSVGPAVAILTFVALGLVVYAIRNARRGAFHDEEMDHRGLGGLIGARARHFFAWLMRDSAARGCSIFSSMSSAFSACFTTET